jgi:DNA-binding response OmpR family regulator
MTVSVTEPLEPARGHIVLADDDEELRELISAILSYDGFEVVELRDGEELVEYIGRLPAEGQDQPDLIISDLCMPARSGLEALHELREAHVSAPVILITAFPERASYESIAELGAAKLLAKPFSFEDLRMAVRDLATKDPRSDESAGQ